MELVLHLNRRATTKEQLKSLYEPVPGDIATATGAKTQIDSATAVREAFSEVCAKLNGRPPHLCIVAVTVTHSVATS